MRKTTKLWVAPLAVWLATGCVWAQQNRESAKESSVATTAARLQTGSFYHLDFVVKEVDGNRVVNSRSYSTSIREGGYNSIRAGGRVPVATGSLNRGGDTAVQTPYMFIDLGANFDCAKVQEMDGKLALKVGVELSSAAPNDQEGPAKTQPTIRQNKWDADVIVPLGKQTIIFSSDNVAGKTKMQVELTATVIK